MAEDVDSEIAAALAKLAQQDAGSVDNAEAALEWIAGELGLVAITQEHVQNFCWYQLPMKWLISHEEKLRVAVALGEVLDLLQLPRYASICRSQATREILGEYEESSRLGKAAFRRAAADSGITPPNLPDFEWGATMGPHEASAWSSVADFLELAVASGGLIPGTRGWKKRQQQLVRTHLNIPQLSLLGQTYAQAILTERAETWANLWRSETRRTILAATANQLLYPAQLPIGTIDPLPRLRWLLGELHGGIALTQTGNLNQKFVQQNADRFGWDFESPPRTEDDLYDMHQVRELAQKLGLARWAGRQLTLTAKGRRLAGDPEQLWRMVAAALLVGDSDFTAYMGELFLAMLLEADSRPFDEILATVWRAAGEEGFREGRTGEPPSEHDVSWAIHDTSNLCRALGLLTSGPDWRDRSYGLTETGKATALKRCALAPRARAPSRGRDVVRMTTGANAGIAKLGCQSATPASAGLIGLTSAAVALNRMNRDEFFAKLAGLDENRIKKALWNLYWRGPAQLRERIEGELDPAQDAARKRGAAKPPNPDTVLREVRDFAKLARAGAYIAGDRRISPKERTRWRLTFRRLAADALAALRQEDSGPAEEAVALLIDLACETKRFDYFRSEDPMEAAQFVVSDAAATLWEFVRERHGFTRFATVAAAQLPRWESAYGWSRSGWGKLAEKETSLASVLGRVLRAPDAWTVFADCYLHALDQIARAEAAEPASWPLYSYPVSDYRRSDRTRDLAEWHCLLLERLTGSEAEDRLDRLAGHPALGGPELTFVQARLAQLRGDTDAARTLTEACLGRLPGHEGFADFAVQIGADLPASTRDKLAERARRLSTTAPG